VFSCVLSFVIITDALSVLGDSYRHYRSCARSHHLPPVCAGSMRRAAGILSAPWRARVSAATGESLPGPAVRFRHSKSCRQGFLTRRLHRMPPRLHTTPPSLFATHVEAVICNIINTFGPALTGLSRPRGLQLFWTVSMGFALTRCQQTSTVFCVSSSMAEVKSPLTPHSQQR